MSEAAEWVEDLEPVSRWTSLRCWLLHWFLHRSAEDDGVTVRFCPRCRLTLSVSYYAKEKEQG